MLILSIFATAMWQSNPALSSEKDDAEKAFEKGLEAFSENRFIEAADAFRRAYQRKPSWKLLYNLGQAEVAGKRYGLALDAFEHYLADGGDDVPRERQQEVKQEIERLRGMVGYLKFNAPKGALISVNGVVRGMSPLNMELPVSASVILTVEALEDGKVIAQSETKVNGGRTATVNLMPTEKADPDDNLTTSLKNTSENTTANAQLSPPLIHNTNNAKTLKKLGWISLGVSTSFLIAGAITGGLALHKNDEINSKCDESGCYDTEYDLLDSRESLANASTIFLTGGAVLAATSFVLLVLSKKKQNKDRPVSAMFNPTGIVLEGSF